MRDTVLQINAKHLLYNVAVFQKLIRPQTKILVNLKGNAYGADAVLTGKLLEKHNLSYFSVAYSNEGIKLRQNNIQTKIIVFNPSIGDFDDLVKYQMEPEVNSIYYLKALLDYLSQKQINQFPVHIKLDTGMHRAGIAAGEIDELINILNTQNHLSVSSVYSHLAAAEDPNEDIFTRQQIQNFENITQEIKNKTGISFMCHLLNTAGVFRFPEAQYEMIRPGLGIYGLNLVDDKKELLKPVFKWTSSISQIINLKKDETVGYNRNFTVQKDSRIALVPIGYADGLNRKLGLSKWQVKINSKPAPIVGNVSMDTISVDVSEINCDTGDEVVIFDTNQDIYKMATLLQTIPYEITASISKRVPRRLI